MRIRNWGLNPKQAQCVTALYVARATQMPNGRWRVIEDRRFAGTSFVDEVSRTCAVEPPP